MAKTGKYDTRNIMGFGRILNKDSFVFNDVILHFLRIDKVKKLKILKKSIF